VSLLGGLGPLEMQMYVDLHRWKSDLDQAQAAASGMAGRVGQVFTALGAGLSVGVFSNWIKGAIDAADEANKMAQKMGVATDKVAGLQLAFEQSGAGGADTMQKAMSKLSVGLIEGNKALDALGIKSTDSRQALALIADQFQRMPDGIEKSALAAGIFGERIGANMIPLLNAGSEGLKEMDKAAEALGLTIDTELAGAAEAFNDNMALVKKSTQGAALSLLNELMPALGVTAKELAEASKHGGAFAEVGDALSVALEAVVVLGSDVAFVFRTLWGEVSSLAQAAKALATDGWAAAVEIRRKFAADAQADRERLDAFQRQLLAQRGLADLRRTDAADAEDRRATEAHNARQNALLREQAEAAKKAAAEMKKLADAENDRLSRRGLAELKRYDEATAEDARLTAEYRKAVQQELEIRAMQDLARQRRVDQAEEEAQKKYEAEVDAAKKANADILADWQRTVDQMGQSFADALMTGGRSVGSYLQGLFRTLVLRPILMPAATALSATISGPAAAMSGASGAAGSAGGLLSLGNAMGSIGTFGGAAGAGFGATMAGAGLGDLLAGAGAMMGQGTMAGIAGGAGLGLGAIAPYALGALALYSLGKKLFSKKLDDAGITGTFSDAGFSGKSFEEYSRIIGGDSRKTKPVSGALDEVFDAGALAARESVRAYIKVLGLPAEAMEGFTQKIKFSTKGQSAKETQEEIERFVRKYAEGLADLYKAPLAQFQKAGESVADTLERLAGLQTFSNTLADLGGVFQRLAGLSVDAREGFIAMAGGMDALGTKALQFVQDYYGRDEIAGIKAAEIKDALAAVGITQDVNSRDDFRRLVDGLDVSTQQGQEQLAALLDMASAFTGVADYLAETGATLSGAAALSPSGGNAAALFGQGGQGELLLATNNVGFWTEAVYNAIVAQTAVITSGSAAPAPAQQKPAPEVNGGNSGGSGSGGSMWQDGVYYGV